MREAREAAFEALATASSEHGIEWCGERDWGVEGGDALLEDLGDSVRLVVHDHRYAVMFTIVSAGPLATLRVAKEWLRLTRGSTIPTLVYVTWPVASRFPRQVAETFQEDPARGAACLYSNTLEGAEPLLRMTSVLYLSALTENEYARCGCPPQGQSQEITERAWAQRHLHNAARLGNLHQSRDNRSPGIGLAFKLRSGKWSHPPPRVRCAREVTKEHHERAFALLGGTESHIARFLQKDGDRAVLTRMLKFLLPPAWPLDFSEMMQWLEGQVHT